MGLLPRLTAREFRAALRLKPNGFAVDDISGAVAGGRLTGELSFRSARDGLKTHAKFSLAGADAASLLPSGARPPVSGTLDLSAELEGAGMSPVALIGSLQGTGKITLADAQIAGLDPRAFDAVTRAVDQGLPIDAARISDVVSKALESGQLAVKRAEGVFAVSAGQIRLEQRRRRQQGRGIVGGRQSRPHRWLARCAAGAVRRRVKPLARGPISSWR